MKNLLTFFKASAKLNYTPSILTSNNIFLQKLNNVKLALPDLDFLLRIKKFLKENFNEMPAEDQEYVAPEV